ncbi:MAG: hypothetical protein PHI58_07145 [Candidatus Omnitrophica bacterium]|nr:hypothetical protein [Candidatus Omnitrophota bacterium]
MKIAKIFIFTVLMIALAHAAHCAEAPAVTVTKQVDAEIPADISKDIHAINDTLFQSMKDNKPNVMMNMFIAEGRTDPELEKGVKAAYERLGKLAKGTAFKILHEYFIDVKGSGTAKVELPGDGTNNFNVIVDAGKGPLYISLMVSGGNFNDLILCFVYLKVKDGWQLYSFHCGLYKVAGKTAVQWYGEAKSLYDNGWDVPAMLRMQLVQEFIRPAPFIQYDKEPEMAAFMKQGITETSRKYKFPFKAVWVKDAPEIYGLDIQFVKGQLTPVVVYVTRYPLKMAAPIQDEADAINSKIGTIIPGLNKTSGETWYRAYTEPPLDAKKEYKYRSVMSKNK